MNTALLKLQIGPVQDFIAQARSTRDLWGGSYLLSWLMGKAAATLLQHPEISLVFPSEAGQPLIAFHKNNGWNGDQKLLLTPNLPNIFVARVPSERAERIAREVEKSIVDEWEAICQSVWDASFELGLSRDQVQRGKAQASRFLSIAWQVTPSTGNYAEDYRRNGWQLDAVRQTRSFAAWGTGACGRGIEKDSITGKEESIAGGRGYADRVSGQFKHLFKHDDHLGAISLVKRVWHLTYLENTKGLGTSSRDFPIPSTVGIAMRKPESDGDKDNVEALQGEKYFAVLALDGDQIGKWIGGEFVNLTEEHHKGFSASLGQFALQHARVTVEEHTGRVIYSGGDDVLALLPADSALACAEALRQAFRDATSAIKGKDRTNGLETSPDCSVGIAIAHFKSPLQDVIREAQLAERRAKCSPEQGGHGRSAVAITLMKRSGETIHWGCKWESNGLDLYAVLDTALASENLANKFPYRVCELLEPYRSLKTGLSRLDDAAGFEPAKVIPAEFLHAAQRQGSKEMAQQLEKPLQRYLGQISGRQEQIASIIGLCQTVAFVKRNKQPGPKLAAI